MSQATIRATTTSVHDPKEALRLLNSALEMSRALGDRAAESKTLWNLMLYHKFAGNPPEAVRNGEASLKIARELNLREQVAFTMNDLVTHGYLDAGEFEKARKLIDEVRELWKELNNLSMLADSYSSAAIVYYILGEYDNTIRVAGEARRVSESIHNLWGESYSRWIVGEVYLERGEIGTALQTMEDCITLGEQAGFIGAASGVGASLTFALGSLGMFSEALDRGGRAVAITEKMLPGWLVWPLSAVACVQVWAGDIPAAVQTANRIEQIIRTEQVMQFPFSLTSVNLALATVRLANNDPAGAHRSLDEMVAYLDRTQLRPYRADAIDLRGKVYLAEDNVEAAAAAFEEARSAAESLQSRHKLWRIYASLADLKVRAGDQAAADDLRRKSREIIEFIADHAGRKEVRDAFLNLSEVRKLHA
jgi:tetratricopeptide (TPR) repeat protein